MKHVYVGDFTLDTLDSQTYSTNNMYDPNVSLGGHQPYGYDQVAAYFYRYTVIASKITFHCELEAGDDEATYAVVRLGDANLAPSTLEEPNLKYKLMNPGNELSRKGTLTASWNACKWWKMSKKALVGNSDYTTLSTTGPKNQCYYNLSTIPFTGITPAADNFTLRVHVRITYWAVWTGPRPIGRSVLHTDPADDLEEGEIVPGEDFDDVDEDNGLPPPA